MGGPGKRRTAPAGEPARPAPADRAAGGPEGEARDALHGAALSRFTAERARLAAALREGGDAAAAARISKLPRPSIPAWAVNKLWREARRDMEALLAAGRAIRGGERDAWTEQRALLGRLGERAGSILAAHGHAATPATLRRVHNTLQALSAAGGFEPDLPGQLSVERDPPGFDAMAGAALPPPPPPRAPAPGETPARARERAVEEQKARSRARSVEITLAGARVKAAEHRVQRLADDLERAEAAVARQREELRAAERELDEARSALDEM